MSNVVPIDARKKGRATVKTVTVPDKPWRELTYEDIGGQRPAKSVVVVRYGAWGDMIMMSSILPELKAQGWHVTVNVTEKGQSLMRTDPHVDELLVQGRRQVPNDELKAYWDWLKGAFDRYIQLSGSIEGSLLPRGPKLTYNDQGEQVRMDPDPAFEWPAEKRHTLLNRNYIEETHRLAGVPFTVQRTRFYPTVSEQQAARKEVERWKRKKGLNRLIMVVWSGSSVHKAYPWMDNVIATLLNEDPGIGIVTAGDDVCKMLDDAWANERRVIKRAGEPIRKTLTMAQLCDMVVGPETGVLNAVAMEPHVRKVVFLSHSSVENVCKHWLNTKALSGNVPCYPCHQLHYGMETCFQCPVTHGAMCQSVIPHESVVEAILGHAPSRAKEGGGVN